MLIVELVKVCTHTNLLAMLVRRVAKITIPSYAVGNSFSEGSGKHLTTSIGFYFLFFPNLSFYFYFQALFLRIFDRGSRYIPAGKRVNIETTENFQTLYCEYKSEIKFFGNYLVSHLQTLHRVILGQGETANWSVHILRKSNSQVSAFVKDITVKR